MKTRKILSIALALLTVLSTLSVFATGALAAGAWDGKTADIGWYVADTSATEFTINTAEELYGASILMAYNEATVSLKGDKKVYYDANNKVIFDAANAGTTSVAATGFQNKTLKLGADIDLNNKPFLPLGSSWALQGNFDGQNHTVKNFIVNAEQADHKSATVNSHYYGFIACLSGGNNYVKNLTVKNVTLNVKPDATITQCVYVGGLIGDAKKDTSWVENCKLDNVIVNLDATVCGTQTIVVGAAIGHLAGNKECSISVTNFEFNNISNCDYYKMLENKLIGLCGSSASPLTPTLTANSTVTMKPENNNQGGNNNQGNTNPDTGDFTTVAIAAVAMISLAGAVVVISKKRTNR